MFRVRDEGDLVPGAGGAAVPVRGGAGGGHPGGQAQPLQHHPAPLQHTAGPGHLLHHHTNLGPVTSFRVHC